MAFRLLMFTGARLQEILTLQWGHIDFERGLINLPDSKTGRKTIVMSGATTDLLRGRERRGAFVIPGAEVDRSRSDLKKPWRAIQRHAGLEGVRIHDLRHTFASIGAGASLGPPIVGKLLGHSQPATTARYAHLDADPLRRASNVIGDHLTAALAGRSQRRGLARSQPSYCGGTRASVLRYLRLPAPLARNSRKRAIVAEITI